MWIRVSGDCVGRERKKWCIHTNWPRARASKSNYSNQAMINRPRTKSHSQSRASVSSAYEQNSQGYVVLVIMTWLRSFNRFSARIIQINMLKIHGHSWLTGAQHFLVHPLDEHNQINRNFGPHVWKLKACARKSMYAIHDCATSGDFEGVHGHGRNHRSKKLIQTAWPNYYGGFFVQRSRTIGVYMLFFDFPLMTHDRSHATQR